MSDQDDLKNELAANLFVADEQTDEEFEDAHTDPEDPESEEDTGLDMATLPWRVAESLLQLRQQVNAKAPRRSKASDGTIGDGGHRNRKSDHNPWVVEGTVGVVTALDITHDPANGCDAGKIAEAIRASRDSRVKYIIWNKKIANHKAIGGKSAWEWRSYGGPNPHTKHAHISVKSDKASYDSKATWGI